ncbi:MAG: PDZ domain-containing protein [Labilithrix sp.]|nr:PDZ domain-containing protein [Labilithrix sp.]MCW5810853.1 PDZ domain-containing protein [Labilithrix sp.]
MRASQLLVLAGLLSSSVASAAPLPSLPGANANAGEAPAAAPSGGTLDLTQIRRGVVQVEQQGRPMAIGTVLSKDGRVLTSLSALGGVEVPEIRYADNSVVKAKVGHKDKAWDLALLIPQTGKWTDGLMPTDADPSGVDIKAFLPKAGKMGANLVAIKGRAEAHAKDGDALNNVLDLDLKGLPSVPGAPLINPDGKVVGVLVRACKDAAPEKPEKPDPKAKAPACTPITIGAPVPALRGFLMKTPTTAVQPAPWLGLGGVPSENGNVKGVRVMGVAPGSPAEKAGLKPTGDSPDTIVAVEGSPVETPEQLAEAIAKRSIGQTVKLLVFSAGKFREVAVTLRAAP